MASPSDNEIFAWLRSSNAYRGLDPKDKAKVDKALAGIPTTRPASLLGRAAWGLAKRLAPTVPIPPPPPPPPLPTYVKVAPRVAYKTDRGDARYCMFDGGNLRPGVTRRPDNRYTDESGAVYAADGDGLEESAVRTPGTPANCPTSASNIDGRPYCSLPLQGDPTKNTGSWTI